MRNLGLIISAIRDSMDGQTSELEDEWDSKVRSRGNCHVAALVLQHYYPFAMILSGYTKDLQLHYWNVLSGVTIDITRDQFPYDVIITNVVDASEEVLTASTEAKRDLLLSRVERVLQKSL